MEEPPLNCTLARLSFWVPAGQMAEFEVIYQTRLAPILKKHDLVESAERGRPTVEGVFSQALWPPGALHRHREGGQKTVEGIFSRLFSVDSPAAVAEKEKALQEDPAWQEVVQNLGATLGAAAPGGSLRWRFWFYRAPAGPGKSVPVGSGKGHWRTFDVTDGLVDMFIRSIFQDREGNLWFSSFSGVGRYDGQQFETFTPKDGLADNSVSSIAQDQEGNLWFGTPRGVSRYDGQHFATFTTKDGLANNIVTSILEDREGNLWFGTHGGGMSRYDGQRFTTLTTKDGLAHDQVFSICQDHEGNLWFGTSGGVSRYDDQQFTSFTKQDGLAHDEVQSILQDHEGNLWFGTNGGVSCYDGTQFKTFTTKDGLVYDQVSSICQDQEGNLWFGTSGGLSRYDGKRFTTFTEQDGLPLRICHETTDLFGQVVLLSGALENRSVIVSRPLNKVTSVCQDREGHLWVGIMAGGVTRCDGQVFQTFTIEGVGSALEDREGNLWFGTWDGEVIRCDGRAFTTFTAQAGLAGNAIWSICQDREGNLWFATGQSGRGVRRYDGQHFTTFAVEDGLAHDNVEVVYQDRQGYLWFGTAGGANRYDGQGFKRFTAEDGLAANYVRSICQDHEGNLWFGTMDGGVSRYDGRAFESFSTRDGLAGNQVRMILQDREGNLWFGTQEGGLSRYDGQHFTTFTTKEGLARDWVWTGLQDQEGNLWFGTLGGGACRYDGQVFQTLTRQDGLASNTIACMLQDRAGRFWFGTVTGVTCYCPPSPSSPSVFLDAVVADRRHEGETEISLPASVKLLAFEFHALSFKTRPEAMVYRYRLDGYEEKWQNTHARRVEYHDLPLGKYTFQVRAVDRDLNYSAPAEVRLKVVPDPRDARIDELEQRVRERTRELEAANRRLRVEAAAERVRSEALSMRASDDLMTVVAVMWQEMVKLGVQTPVCSFQFIDEEADQIRQYIALENPRKHGISWTSPEVMEVDGDVIVFRRKDSAADFISSPIFSDFMERWRKEETWSVTQSAAETMAVMRHFQETYGFDRLLPLEGNWVVTNMSFRYGTVGFRERDYSEEHVAAVQELTSALSLAYTRFLDLQAAEERARQQARELAIEHVRNEALSMRSSEDLHKVVVVMWKEMVKLGVGTPGANIGFVDEKADCVRWYLALENPRKHQLSWSSPVLVELDADTAVSASEGSFSSFIFSISVFSQGAIDFRECWHEGKPSSFIQSPQGAEILEKIFVEEWGFDHCPPNWAGEWVITNVLFQYGFVGFRERQHSEEHIAIVQDLTSALELGYFRFQDFQRLEEQNRALEQANVQIQEANQHKSQFLSRMSHDLRTPMNAIIGYTRILLRKTKEALDERQYQNLQNIQLSADHLLALINDILDLSRVEAGRIELKLEEVDLKKLVQECAAAVASLLRPGVELRQQGEEVPALHTDPDRLRRVLMNLLSNAVKFTEQGSITVAVRRVEGWVEVSVADTGVGIPAEDLPHIFEEFRQVERQGQRPEGSGLGLAIARKSVELLGGTIAVESAVGEGTKFTLRIREYGG